MWRLPRLAIVLDGHSPIGFYKPMLTAARGKAPVCLRLTIILVGLAMTEGCRTFDSDNTSARPWDRPTRWEVGQDWVFRPDTSNLKPGDNYP
jgi:hypothetical protein